MDITESAIDKVPIDKIKKGVTKVLRKGNYEETASKGLADMIPKLTKKQFKQACRLLKRSGASQETLDSFQHKWNQAHSVSDE